MKTTIIIFAAACILAGCDQGVSETVQIKQLEEKKAVREATEKKDFSSAMVAYIKGKCELAEAERKALEKKVLEAKSDAGKLSSALEKTIGAEPEYSIGVMKALRDEAVNALAIKYLSAGFQTQSKELLAKLGEHDVDMRRYHAALKENDGSYATNTVASHGWQVMTREKREKEIKRIREEIQDLENKLQSARRQMLGSKQRETDRLEKKYQYERELEQKRRQLDIISDPERARRMEMDAQRAQTVNWQDANRTWRDNRVDIDYRLKPRQATSDIAKAIESITIAKLQLAIRNATEKYGADYEKAEKKANKLKELALSVSVSSASELRTIKLQADKL